MVCVGLDGEASRKRLHQPYAVGLQSRILGGGCHGRGQRHPILDRRRLLGLAVVQHIAGQGGGPTQGPLQTRQGLGHLGVGGIGQTLRGDLGRGQHVAQVVVDLGHRLAQRHET